MSSQIKTINNIPLISAHSSRPFIADIRYVKDHVKKPIIIFIHGFKGFKDWGHFNLIADHVAKQGFVFIKPNLSHNGTTPDHPMDFADLEAFSENNFSIELDDLAVLIDFLSGAQNIVPAEEINMDQLFLIGHSRGGSIALLKAYEDTRVKKVAAWAPIHNLFQRWPEELVEKWRSNGTHYIFNSRTGQDMPLKYQLIEDLQKNKVRLDVSGAVQQINKPVLLIHGTEDETLPYQHTVELATIQPLAESFIVEGANHVFGGKHPYENPELPEASLKVLNKTLSFFQKGL
ncbi:alpha/beta fold hydrolase [Fulvivirga sp. M361]|uniref:alpha/beta hydrolase family protein n=1 Tax=Fulvivirga sp. M361 TaxID=2594266 RepID=UPI00117B3FCC|nr:alpha/beta fold hydrolase [Fulvivirga sp. M361]TRX54282.1 alpha/beta fold hydrolase [Fulvivirga sp. M361]